MFNEVPFYFQVSKVFLRILMIFPWTHLMHLITWLNLLLVLLLMMPLHLHMCLIIMKAQHLTLYKGTLFGWICSCFRQWLKFIPLMSSFLNNVMIIIIWMKNWTKKVLAGLIIHLWIIGLQSSATKTNNWYFSLTFSIRKCLEEARLLLKMKHGMCRLDRVWGVGGGRLPVKCLVKKVFKWIIQ